MKTVRQQFLPFILNTATAAKQAKLNRYDGSQSLNSMKYLEAREEARAFQLAQAISRGRVRSQVENNPNTDNNISVVRLLRRVQVALSNVTGVSVHTDHLLAWYLNPETNLSGDYVFIKQD